MHTHIHRMVYIYVQHMLDVMPQIFHGLWKRAGGGALSALVACSVVTVDKPADQLGQQSEAALLKDPRLPCESLPYESPGTADIQRKTEQNRSGRGLLGASRGRFHGVCAAAFDGVEDVVPA